MSEYLNSYNVPWLQKQKLLERQGLRLLLQKENTRLAEVLDRLQRLLLTALQHCR